ncbi:hypothetical protein GCM10011415_06550 [Salipiger pallidus]|uniref:Uncharacterized protein n=1 Tax=Salipiger pallidus TaxID=1775170 RepID=A0A8J2ZGW9_9RHOB|nr:hypothetical protein GCM10011415_06550 [Salipiger pallidus]
MNDLHEIQVTQMRLIHSKPNASRRRVLAAFDMTYAGLRIFGATLLQDEDGVVSAHGPRGKGPSGSLCCAVLQDDALKTRVRDEAARVYEGFTGRQLVTDVEA